MDWTSGSTIQRKALRICAFCFCYFCSWVGRRSIHPGEFRFRWTSFPLPELCHTLYELPSSWATGRFVDGSVVTAGTSHADSVNTRRIKFSCGHLCNDDEEDVLLYYIFVCWALQVCCLTLIVFLLFVSSSVPILKPFLTQHSSLPDSPMFFPGNWRKWNKTLECKPILQFAIPSPPPRCQLPFSLTFRPNSLQVFFLSFPPFKTLLLLPNWWLLQTKIYFSLFTKFISLQDLCLFNAGTVSKQTNDSLKAGSTIKPELQKGSLAWRHHHHAAVKWWGCTIVQRLEHIFGLHVEVLERKALQKFDQSLFKRDYFPAPFDFFSKWWTAGVQRCVEAQKLHSF